MRRRTIILILACGALALIAGAAIRFFDAGYGEKARFRFYSAEFRRITIADPLFWDRSLDPGALETAIVKLRAVEREFPAGNEPLWPISFVEKLPEVGRHTENFIHNPTYANAAKLLRAYETAATAYASELKKLKTAADESLRNADAEDENELLKNLPVLEKNAGALLVEIERRRECVRSGKCALVFPAIPELRPEPRLYPARLTEALAFRSEEERAAIHGVFRVPSECWTDARGWYELYALETRSPQAAGVMRIRRADENIYLVIETERGIEARRAAGGVHAVAAELERPWLEAGLPLRYIGSGFRRCSDMTHYPRTLTLLWLKERLKAGRPIAANLTEAQLPESARPFARSAIETEQELIGSGTPSWSSATRLATYLGSILEAREKKFFELPDLAFIELSAIRSAITSGLPLFDVTLEALAEDLSYLPTLFSRGDAAPDLGSRAAIHNYLSILYFPFSQAMWRIEESPVFLRKFGGGKEPLPVDSVESLRERYGFQTVFSSQIRHLFTETELAEITNSSMELTLKLFP